MIMKPRKIVITPKRKALLRKVARAIETHPEKYRQDTFACGTAACIAGHIVAQAPAKPLSMRALFEIPSPNVWICAIQTKALDALDFKPHSPSADSFVRRMFNADAFGWPESFYNAYHEARSRPAKAKVAAARIRHMIRTGE